MEIAFPENIASPASKDGSQAMSSDLEDRLTSDDDEFSIKYLPNAYTGGSGIKPKHRRRRRISEEEAEKKRLLANCQERQRANRLGRALDKLRGVLPKEFMPLNKKPSKIRTLRLAISYIRGLSSMLCHSRPLLGQNPQPALHCGSDPTLQHHSWSPFIHASPQCYSDMTSLKDEGYSSFSDTLRLSDPFVGPRFSPLACSPCPEEIRGPEPGCFFRQSTPDLKALASGSLSLRRQQTTMFCFPGPLTPSPSTFSAVRPFEPLPGDDDLKDVKADVVGSGGGYGGGAVHALCPRFSMDQDDSATYRNPSSLRLPPPAVELHTHGSFSFSSTPVDTYFVRPPPRFGLDPEPL